MKDVLIVGAGAAGLMAAVTCGRKSLKPILLEGHSKPGAKILISGGTHCNVTHNGVSEKDYAGGNPRVIRNILRGFPHDRAVEFFEGLGVKLVLEDDGKFFPATHSAKTILEALLVEIEKTGGAIEVLRKVKRIEPRQDFFSVEGDGFSYEARTVILCAGGCSYPATGSDGTGFEIAQTLGHCVVSPTPALTPLQTEDPDWKSLTGISLPCRLTLRLNGKKTAMSEGQLLFTHFGFSGPCILDISRHWLRAGDPRSAELFAHFLPEENEASICEALREAAEEYPKLLLKNLLARALPERVAAVLLKKLKIQESCPLNQLKKTERELLARAVCRFPLEISEALGYDKAEVTAGGVDLNEVNPKTLESKRWPGLFFAGEILDVDGPIGGFNFQWAWASGVAAAQGALDRISFGKKMPGSL